MTEEAQALFDLISAAYAEHYDSDLNQRYHAILLKYAKELDDGADLDKTRLALYIDLYRMPYFRPMTLPKVGRTLYGALHTHCMQYDAKELRRQFLAYGIIVAGGTWGQLFS